MANVIIVANVWAGVPRNAAGARGNKLPTTSPKLTSGGGPRTAHYYNTAQSAHFIIRMITKNCQLMGHVNLSIYRRGYVVDAGTEEAANRELEERIRQHQAGLEGVRKNLWEMDKKATQKLEEQIRHHQGELMEVLKEMDEEARRELEEHIGQHQDELKEVGREMLEVLMEMFQATRKDLRGHNPDLSDIALEKALEEKLEGLGQLGDAIRNRFIKWEGTPEEMIEMLEETRKNMEERTERCRVEVEDGLEKMMKTLREMSEETMKELEERVWTVFDDN